MVLMLVGLVKSCAARAPEIRAQRDLHAAEFKDAEVPEATRPSGHEAAQTRLDKMLKNSTSGLKVNHQASRARKSDTSDSAGHASRKESDSVVQDKASDVALRQSAELRRSLRQGVDSPSLSLSLSLPLYGSEGETGPGNASHAELQEDQSELDIHAASQKTTVTCCCADANGPSVDTDTFLFDTCMQKEPSKSKFDAMIFWHRDTADAEWVKPILLKSVQTRIATLTVRVNSFQSQATNLNSPKIQGLKTTLSEAEKFKDAKKRARPCKPNPVLETNPEARWNDDVPGEICPDTPEYIDAKEALKTAKAGLVKEIENVLKAHPEAQIPQIQEVLNQQWNKIPEIIRTIETHKKEAETELKTLTSLPETASSRPVNAILQNRFSCCSTPGACPTSFVEKWKSDAAWCQKVQESKPVQK